MDPRFAISGTLHPQSVAAQERTITKEEMACCMLGSTIASTQKGSSGKIGVVGGSLEYTGAPFFAAVAALRMGAELSHVFCTRESATAIKSYSPDVIVHPVLPCADDEGNKVALLSWISRMTAVVIGPGLGRDAVTLEVIPDVYKVCADNKVPLVVDADAISSVPDNLYLLNNNVGGCVITPNAREARRLTQCITGYYSCLSDAGESLITAKWLAERLPSLLVLCKGNEDAIVHGRHFTICDVPGSLKRPGGIGDLLSGVVAALLGRPEVKFAVHGYPSVFVACSTMRRAAKLAFDSMGWSMTAADVLSKIPEVLNENVAEFRRDGKDCVRTTLE